jgi:hypothetical protein
MWDRAFDLPALAFLGLAAVLGFAAGLWIGARRQEGAPRALGRAVEAAALAPLGGFLARTFVGLLLYAGGDSPAAALAVGWAFLLWPGAVDTLLVALHVGPVFTPAALLGSAAAVGSYVGLMDGLWRVHAWPRAGVLLFVLDTTWGLAGSANGCLVHLANLVLRARRGAESRRGCHHYLNGFRFKRGYAVTLGAVMSNVPEYAHDLMQHERQHVLQNRLFGPLYTLTYLGWMVLMLAPALAAGLARGTPARTVEDWCYLNNPWEAWAYAWGGWRDPARLWDRRVWTIVAVLFFLGVLGTALWVVWRVWLA